MDREAPDGDEVNAYQLLIHVPPALFVVAFLWFCHKYDPGPEDPIE